MFASIARLLIVCVLAGCAGGGGLPGVAVHAASVAHEAHGPAGTRRSWGFVLSADLSFRFGSALRVVRGSEAAPPELLAKQRGELGVDAGCAAARLCAWERAAVMSALGAMGEDEEGTLQ